MAIIQKDDQQKEVKDGSRIKEACEEMGLPFGCKSGLCRTCEIKVLEGMENLGPLNEMELMHSLPPENRLACQCSILKGKIKIKSVWD